MSDSELPDGWCLASVGDVMRVRNGFAFKSTDYTATGIPLIRQADLKGRVVDLADAKHLPLAFADQHSSYLVNKGDLLIGMSGSLGKVSRYEAELPALQNQRTGLLILDEAIDCRFASLIMRRLERSIIQKGKGIAVQNVSSREIESEFFPLPPAPEQSRISDRVDELESDLDAGVAALRRAKANLKRYRAAVLKAAVEGKLTEEWRAKHPGTEPASKLLARILTERRQKWEADQFAKFAAAGKEPPKGWRDKYVDPSPPDLTDVPELPRGWEIASVDQLATTITSGSRDWSQYYGTGTGTFIMAQNVRPGRLDMSFRQAVNPPTDDRDRVRSQVAKGDLLVTIVGANTGDICRVDDEYPDHYVCQSVALMRLVHTTLSPFVEAYFVSHENGQRQFRRYIYGQGRPHLGFDQLRVTPVLLPPIDEQSTIVTTVSEKLSQIDAAELGIDHGLARAARLRQSILKQAFEGKLVPQDPTDEPASVLLHRLRCSRSTGDEAMSSKSSGRTRKKSGVRNELE